MTTSPPLSHGDLKQWLRTIEEQIEAHPATQTMLAALHAAVDVARDWELRTEDMVDEERAAVLGVIVEIRRVIAEGLRKVPTS